MKKVEKKWHRRLVEKRQTSRFGAQWSDWSDWSDRGEQGILCAMRMETPKAQGVVFCWLAGRMAQSTGCGLCKTDWYGLVRMSTE